jgi:hypothetical protein
MPRVWMKRAYFDERIQDVDARLPKIGERQRRHHHYLKGSLWCGRCPDKGVESRLLLTEVRDRWGSEFGTSSALLAKTMHAMRRTSVLRTPRPECYGTTPACGEEGATITSRDAGHPQKCNDVSRHLLTVSRDITWWSLGDSNP